MLLHPDRLKKRQFLYDLLALTYMIENDDLCCTTKKLDLMSDQDANLPTKILFDRSRKCSDRSNLTEEIFTFRRDVSPLWHQPPKVDRPTDKYPHRDRVLVPYSRVPSDPRQQMEFC